MLFFLISEETQCLEDDTFVVFNATPRPMNSHQTHPLPSWASNNTNLMDWPTPKSVVGRRFRNMPKNMTSVQPTVTYPAMPSSVMSFQQWNDPMSYQQAMPLGPITVFEV